MNNQSASFPDNRSAEAQKRFIGDLAHEIRTPLAIIKATTEVELMNPAISSETRTSLEGIMSELDRISETLRTLLS